MERYYNAVLHKDKGSIWGVTFPDFPGCTVAEKTKEKAMQSAREALQLTVDVMFEDGEPIPEPSDKLDSKSNVIYALIPVDVPTRNLRINISMADYVIEKIDKYAKSHGETRSGLLSRAAQDYILTH